jgi:hypothetical protein
VKIFQRRIIQGQGAKRMNTGKNQEIWRRVVMKKLVLILTENGYALLSINKGLSLKAWIVNDTINLWVLLQVQDYYSNTKDTTETWIETMTTTVFNGSFEHYQSFEHPNRIDSVLISTAKKCSNSFSASTYLDIDFYSKPPIKLETEYSQSREKSDHSLSTNVLIIKHSNINRFLGKLVWDVFKYMSNLWSAQILFKIIGYCGILG